MRKRRRALSNLNVSVLDDRESLWAKIKEMSFVLMTKQMNLNCFPVSNLRR